MCHSRNGVSSFTGPPLTRTTAGSCAVNQASTVHTFAEQMLKALAILALATGAQSSETVCRQPEDGESRPALLRPLHCSGLHMPIMPQCAA